MLLMTLASITPAINDLNINVTRAVNDLVLIHSVNKILKLTCGNLSIKWTIIFRNGNAVGRSGFKAI